MSPRPRRAAVVAHRGDCFRFRENTLPAFRSALDLGVDRVELDIRTTADGHSIVLHDATLLRLWGLPERPENLSYAQIAGLGFADVRIPLLAEVLDLLDGTGVGVLIDTGDPATIDAALTAVRDRPRDLEVHWCGAVAAMQRVRNLDTDAVVHYNVEDGVVDPEVVRALRPSYLNIDGTLLDLGFVDRAHAEGLQVSVWTIDDAQALRLCFGLGVDSVTTNRSRRALQVRAEDRMPSSPHPSTANGDAAAERLAGELGAWALAYVRGTDVGPIETKAHDADLVTAVDTAVERQVRAAIAEQLPDHHVVGEEEGGHAVPGEPCWYLDPVDGTTNLAAGLPWNSFSLALAIDREPQLAVVADPWRAELVTARRGAGARVAGMSSRCPDTARLAGGLVLTEWLAHVPFAGMPRLLAELAQRDVTTRIMGSGTLAVTSVGAGRALGAVIGWFNPIDHLAGVLIVHEAGGVVRDRTGADTLWPAGGPFLVAAPGVADELTELFLAAISPAPVSASPNAPA